MVFKVCTIVRDHLFASILPLTQRYDLTSLVNLDKNICSGFLKQWFFHSLIDPPPSMEDCHNCPLFSSAFLNCRFLLLTHTCRPGHHLENTFVSTISTLTLSRIILAIAYFTYPPSPLHYPNQNTMFFFKNLKQHRKSSRLPVTSFRFRGEEELRSST